MPSEMSPELHQIIEIYARETFIELHSEEFAQFKAIVADIAVRTLQWKAARDKEKESHAQPER